MDKKSLKILKYLKSNGPATSSDLEKLINNKYIAEATINYLLSNEFIYGTGKYPFYTGENFKLIKTEPFILAPKGFSFLENKPKDILRYWTPIIISIISLLVSIIGLIA